MTRLYDVTIGQFDQFKRILAETGNLTGEDIDAVLRRPEVVKGMADWLRKQLASPLFSVPQDVLDRFLFYTGIQGWPFDESTLEQLQLQMPTNHVSSLDKVLTLDVWLGDLPTTFETLVAWIEYGQHRTGSGFWRRDGLKSDAKHLLLLDAGHYGKKPSVKWVELDMLANRGSRPRDVRDPKTSAGLQVLTAFAVHPAYPPAIDYQAIPGAWMAGLQATIPGDEAWAHVPILYWSRYDRKVNLNARWDGGGNDYYAVPVVREL